jgi:hypothetical protein
MAVATVVQIVLTIATSDLRRRVEVKILMLVLEHRLETIRHMGGKPLNQGAILNRQAMPLHKRLAHGDRMSGAKRFMSWI